MPKVLGIIPARLASTRLPRKMLALINGRPLVYWTWRQAKKAKLLDEVVVATESQEIYDAVVRFGGRAVMTSATHTSGTHRVADAAKQFPWAKVVINIQGDEPLISPSAIDAVAQLLLRNAKISMATVAGTFQDEKEMHDPSNGKVVLDSQSNALYFSRAVIPYTRHLHNQYLKHIGIYGFQRSFLQRYIRLLPTPLEQAEGLEQLRVLEHGYPIRVIVGKYSSIGVDTLVALARVRRFMKHV